MLVFKSLKLFYFLFYSQINYRRKTHANWHISVFSHMYNYLFKGFCGWLTLSCYNSVFMSKQQVHLMETTAVPKTDTDMSQYRQKCFNMVSNCYTLFIPKKYQFYVLSRNIWQSQLHVCFTKIRNFDLAEINF